MKDKEFSKIVLGGFIGAGFSKSLDVFIDTEYNVLCDFVLFGYNSWFLNL